MRERGTLVIIFLIRRVNIFKSYDVILVAFDIAVQNSSEGGHNSKIFIGQLKIHCQIKTLCMFHCCSENTSTIILLLQHTLHYQILLIEESLCIGSWWSRCRLNRYTCLAYTASVTNRENTMAFLFALVLWLHIHSSLQSGIFAHSSSLVLMK